MRTATMTRRYAANESSQRERDAAARAARNAAHVDRLLAERDAAERRADDARTEMLDRLPR